jgi:hypothetical protein
MRAELSSRPRWRFPLLGGAASLALIAVVGSGCSGINVSKSVSPINFLLPALMQNAPATPLIPGATNAPPELVRGGHDLLSMQTQPNSSL